MASPQQVKDVQKFPGTPTGVGGQMLNNNCDALVNRVGPIVAFAFPPTTTDDSADSSGHGAMYTNTVWIDTNSGHVWICMDSSAQAALWRDLTQLARVSEDTTPALGGHLDLNSKNLVVSEDVSITPAEIGTLTGIGNPIQPQIDAAEKLVNKNQLNGYAGLTDGKIDISVIPDYDEVDCGGFVQ